MDKREIICIECPRGCDITVITENGITTEIKGNLCPKGKVYAENEMTNPLRTVTSTVRLDNGEMLPVKTDSGVPKNKIFDVMRKIDKLHPKTPVKIGEIILNDIEKGVNIIATRNCGG